MIFKSSFSCRGPEWPRQLSTSLQHWPERHRPGWCRRPVWQLPPVTQPTAGSWKDTDNIRDTWCVLDLLWSDCNVWFSPETSEWQLLWWFFLTKITTFSICWRTLTPWLFPSEVTTADYLPPSHPVPCLLCFYTNCIQSLHFTTSTHLFWDLPLLLLPVVWSQSAYIFNDETS